MITLVIVAVWELAIVVLPDSGLPPEMTAGLLALLVLSMVALSGVDLSAGFVPRLAYLFALAWYIGSVGRWIVPMDTLFIEVAPMPGMTLALALLIVGPLGLLMMAAVGPTQHAIRKYRRRNR